MEYIYYEQIKTDVHYLFAEEICKILNQVGIAITKNQIHAIMRKYCEENHINSLYFKTSNGLKKVYDLDLVLKLITKEQTSNG